MPIPLDLDHTRAQFPVFSTSAGRVAMFENAGGSYVCEPVVRALTEYLTHRRVQPGYPAGPSSQAAAAMDLARSRWADVLGVGDDEVHLGPSTSTHTYVLAQALRERLGPGDEVVVTDADHEAHRGAIERAAAAAGATVRVWRPDETTGVLDAEALRALVGPTTRWVHVPHVSNVIGVEHDLASIVDIAHAVGARVSVDAVSAAPHGIPDVGALGADVWLCSLYKVFSLHQGLAVIRSEVRAELGNQSHFFNAGVVHKSLLPSGPDHAQLAASAAVLDYVAGSAAHHGEATDDAAACRAMSQRWRRHEDELVAPMLEWLHADPRVDLVGPANHDHGHRCPTISFVPHRVEPHDLAAALAARDVAVGAGHFYSPRTLDAVGVDPTRGVVRASAVHYTGPDDVERLLTALEETL